MSGAGYPARQGETRFFDLFVLGSKALGQQAQTAVLALALTSVTLLGLLAMEHSIAPVATLTGLSDQSRACLERLQSHQPEQVDLFV